MKNDPLASDYKLKDYDSRDYKSIDDSFSPKKVSEKKEKVTKEKSKLKIAKNDNWRSRGSGGEDKSTKTSQPNVIDSTQFSDNKTLPEDAPKNNSAGKIKIVKSERKEYEPHPDSFRVDDDDDDEREDMVVETPLDILLEKLKTPEKPPKYYVVRGGVLITGFIILCLVFGPFGVIFFAFIMYHVFYKKKDKDNSSL